MSSIFRKVSRTKIELKLRRRLSSQWLSVRRQSPLKILILGSEGCGKTSIVRRYAGDTFHEEKNDPPVNTFNTNVFLDFGNKAKEYNVEIIEISRQKCPHTYLEHLSTADGFILVYSKDNADTFLNIIQALADLHKVKKDKPSVIVLANKSDIHEKLHHVSEYTNEQKQIEFSGFNYFIVSAKTNFGIFDAFNALIKQCVKKSRH